MGSIDDDGISTSIDKCLHTLQRIGSNANTCSHTQTAFLVLASHRLILGLCNVLIGNQTYQSVVLIDNGQFLNLVLLQNLGSRRQVGLLMGGNEVLFRHHLIDGAVETALETQVAVGDDTNETLLTVNHRDTADMILSHDIESLGNRRTERNGNWVIDHTILGTLNDGHLTGLILNRHILVNHTDTAFTGDGNSHLALRHRIHSGRHERHVQLDVTRKAGFQLYCLGQYFRVGRNQEDVVERQAVHHNLVCNK